MTESIRRSVHVARDEEVGAAIRELSRPPSFVLVVGEAGVGKSRLVEEVVSSEALREERVLVGRAQELHEPFPLGPIVEALRSADPDWLRGRSSGPLAGVLTTLLPELSSVLPEPIRPASDPGIERHRIFRAIRDLLSAMPPLTFVLEDLHWADDATVDLLIFLAADPVVTVNFIITFRREELPEGSPLLTLASRASLRAGATIITLRALDAGATGVLTRVLLGADSISDVLTAHVHERTGGVPFFIEEVVKLLESRRGLAENYAGWAHVPVEDLGVPGSILDAIEQRVGRVSLSAQRTVRAAAVVGVPAHAHMLGGVSGLAPAALTEAISAAIRSTLLSEVGSGRYDFRHVLARQAVYDLIPAPERRELHARAAGYLMSHGPEAVAQLAHHSRGAGDHVRWIMYAERAAKASIALGDFDAASSILLDVLEESDVDQRVRPGMLRTLCLVAWRATQPRRALAQLDRSLREDKPSEELRALLEMTIGSISTQLGDLRSARAAFQRAYRSLSGDPARQAICASNLAVPWSLETTIAEHLEYQRIAESLASSSGNELVQSIVGRQGTGIRLWIGDPEAVSALQSLRAARDADTDARWTRAAALVNASGARLYLGYVQDCAALLDEAERLCDGVPWLALGLPARRIHVELLAGRWEGLEEHALALLADARTPQHVGMIRHSMALLRLAQDGGRTAVREAEVALEESRRRCDLFEMGEITAALARRCRSAGSTQVALGYCDEVTTIAQRQGLWIAAALVLPEAVLALREERDQTSAEDLVDQFEQGIIGRDAPLANAMLEFARGILIRGRAGEAHIEASIAALEAASLPVLSAVAKAELGEVAKERALEVGRDLLLEAHLALSEIGASWEAARVARGIRRAGGTPPRRSARRRGESLLTPREEEIAALAAAGQTNREIAQTLFLTVRTVEFYIGVVLRKLEVNSRREIGPALAEGVAE